MTDEIEKVDFEDLTKINVPWLFLGEYTRYRLGISDGVSVEVLTQSHDETGWVRKMRGTKFKPVNVYRQKPEPLTKPSIDWSHVAPEYKWLARNGFGHCSLWVEKPCQRDREWMDGLRFLDAMCFTSLDAGTCDWKDSLVERPEGE